MTVANEIIPFFKIDLTVNRIYCIQQRWNENGEQTLFGIKIQLF